MTGKNAGLKPGDRGKSLKYDIISDCDRCTLEMYIKMVCDGDLSVLVVSGEPGEDVLEAARIKIVSEFSVLTGSSDKMMSVTRKVYFYHSLILTYAICGDLIAAGEVEEAVKVLNQKGVRCTVPVNVEEREKLLKRIKSAITEKKIRLKEENKRMKELQEKKSGKVKREDFIQTLVALSKHAGFRLTTGISLTEYAAYLKDYNREIEQLKQMKYGKNNK